MKNNIKKFFDFYKRKSIAVKTFKHLHENFKSLSVFYRIIFVLGIIMPFVMFIAQYFGLLGFFDSYDVIGIQKYGVMYILKNNKISVYRIIHPVLALLVNLIALLKDKYNIKIIIIDIIMFCCASYFIYLIFLGIIMGIMGLLVGGF